MSRRELLFLTNLLPFPLDDGASFKTYHVLRYLSQTWDITLISFIRSLDEHKYRSELGKICHRIEMVPIRRSRIRDFVHFILSLVSPKPFLIRRDYSQRMKKAVDEVLGREHFDTIYVDHLHMAQYVHSRTQRKILDEHNLESELALRYAKVVKNPVKKLTAYLDYKKMRAYEVRTCRSFDLVLTVTEKERRALLNLGVPDTYCLPIGVDTKKLKRLELNRESKTIVFLGTMYWPPNTDAVLWFFRRIFPLIRRSIPEARLSILGSKPSRAVRKLASDTNVNVLGYVDNPEALLTDCAAFIVPLRIGGGMRVKILNAFSWGLPVVSTTLGVEGIEALDNRHLLIRDDPGDFAQAVTQLIEDRELRMRLSQEGRKAAETIYDWEVLSKRMDGIFNGMVKPR
jgi:glycosyltransferase involved in cell wall biosynthesis